jgi:predicted P-loop ATPase/GTPase
MYGYSRVFLLQIHPYRRVASTFNGKPEKTKRHNILSLLESLRVYDIEKEKEIA